MFRKDWGSLMVDSSGMLSWDAIMALCSSDIGLICTHPPQAQRSSRYAIKTAAAETVPASKPHDS